MGMEDVVRRSLLVAALLVASGIVVAQARADGVRMFGPALAAQPTATLAVPATEKEVASGTPSPISPAASPDVTASPDPSATAASTPVTDTAAPVATPVPAVPPLDPTVLPAPAPDRTPAPTPLAVVALPSATTAVACRGGSWFCYPRLGITGAIVPYDDCSGATNVGTQIRSFSCLSDRYLMAHAYTQFGRITGWQAGDIVFAYGQSFTVTGAFVQNACEQPRLPLAPLEMQTSLTSSSCGQVLVVLAR